MSPGERWLRDRAAGAPAELLETMAAAIPDGVDEVPRALAEAAQSLYRRVAGGRGGREDALPLLAADALLTHAFEAQAEVDPAAIRALAASWSATELSREVIA